MAVLAHAATTLALARTRLPWSHVTSASASSWFERVSHVPLACWLLLALGPLLLLALDEALKLRESRFASYSYLCLCILTIAAAASAAE